MIVSEYEGYRREYECYGCGTPGYYFRITRLSDGAVMRAGPYVDPEQEERHPDWDALPEDERRRIVRGLRAAARI